MARDSLSDIGGDDGGQADGDQGGEMDARLPSERPTARTRAAPRTRTLDGALREGGAAPGQSETALADAGETATARPDFGDLGSDQRSNSARRPRPTSTSKSMAGPSGAKTSNSRTAAPDSASRRSPSWHCRT